MSHVMPSREACVVPDLIARHAAAHPDKVFAVFDDGEAWTYAELAGRVGRLAAGLEAEGVTQGDFVLSWLPNGPTALAVMFAINCLGAVYVPINTSYRGIILEHVLRNSGARLMIGDDRLIGRMAEVDRAAVDKIVVVGDGRPQLAGIELVPFARLSEAGPAPKPRPRPVEPWDTQNVIYTSGTTGPSKGVLTSYHQAFATMSALAAYGPDDRTLATLPLFHVGGTGAVYGALAYGASVVIVEAFDTARFWDTVRRFGVTYTVLLGVMTPFLLKQPPAPNDRDHTLRMAVMVPLADDADEFHRRFGTDIYTVFNMTEVSCPLVSEANPMVRGTAGRPRAGVEVRIVDENDCEVAVGAVGELIVRTDLPWAMNHGYLNNPEATAKAWRNGWFHTGDAFRKDAEGNFFFVDRMKDALRRRGENISSFEVESVIALHPDVREAAVVAAKSDLSEDEVMAVIAPAPGRTVDPAELIEFLRPRLPHFMVPRYVRVMLDLPKTPTQKVQKHMLRQAGITPDTWDREAAGISVKREKLAERR
jgi:crotonobetaine/carnitine-CoA ligase